MLLVLGADPRSGQAVPRLPWLGTTSKISVSVDIVHTDLNWLHLLNLFSKEKVIWRQMQNNYADSTSTANIQEK